MNDNLLDKIISDGVYCSVCDTLVKTSEHNIKNYIITSCDCRFNLFSSIEYIATEIASYEYNKDIVIYLNKKYNNYLYNFVHVIHSYENWVVVFNLNESLDGFSSMIQKYQLDLDFCPIYYDEQKLEKYIKQLTKTIILK